MNTNDPNWVQWVTAVLVLFTLGLGLFYVPGMVDKKVQAGVDSIVMPVMPVVPTAAEIAALIPTPEVPDTYYSIQDDKKELAEGLARDELSDKDFKEWLADKINNVLFTDLDKNDIENINVLDVKVNLIGWVQESANVKFTAKVTVDDDGDEELIKVKFSMDVDDLVRDDDYEDAEVDEGSFSDFELVRCYNDYC